MNLVELKNAFKTQKIEKRTYWKMMREKCALLIEYQKFLETFKDDIAICISKDDVILNYRGINLAFDFSQSICRAEGILNMGENPEQEEFDFLFSCINPGDTVLDIGANVGAVSLAINKEVPAVGNIFAFEPLLPTFKRLKHNLSLNDNPQKIRAFNIGLSNEAGDFDFYLPGTDEAASMQPNLDEYYMQESVDGIYTGRKKLDKFTCKVDTLDAFVTANNISKVDIIKIDVEGNELNVLSGGANVLLKYKPLIYTEMLRKHSARFGYTPNDIIEFMKKHKYKCFYFSNGILKEFLEMTENTTKTNFFFLHEERHAAMINKCI